MTVRCYPVIRLNHSGMMLETETHLARDGRSGVPDLDDSSILFAAIQGRTGTGRKRPTAAICGVLFDGPLTGGEPSFSCTYLAGPLLSLSDTETARLMPSAAEQKSPTRAPTAQT